MTTEAGTNDGTSTEGPRGLELLIQAPAGGVTWVNCDPSIPTGECEVRVLDGFPVIVDGPGRPGPEAQRRAWDAWLAKRKELGL